VHTVRSVGYVLRTEQAMVAGVRRRLAFLYAYAAIFAATLLLLGSVLYLWFARHLAKASAVTLGLAA
jgi:hypothetical protein